MNALEIRHENNFVVVQLLSYFAALQRDVNPDYPRNLAKSVTVK